MIGKPIKYALHPGEVISENDGDKHYISCAQLAKLYRLDPDEYIEWHDIISRGRIWNDYVHLYPKSNGKYGRPLHLMTSKDEKEKE